MLYYVIKFLYRFYSGDIANFKDDLAFVKPTLFVAVPRLYNKIVDGVKAQFNEVTGLKRYLLDQGVSTKLHNVRTTGECKHFFYDTLIFNKVK